MSLPYLDAAAVRMPMTDAVDALEKALLGGLDPESEPARGVVDVPAGQLLFMPASGSSWSGVKIASIAPANPEQGLPRIQALYLLLDGATLTPRALLDGTELTSVRTPAVSALAARHMAAPVASRLLVFGTGPQAWGHVEALRAVRPIRSVGVVGRDQGRVTEFVGRCRAFGLEAAPQGPESVAEADLVVCATTAREPLFDGARLRPDACVIAVGSHEPTAREVDAVTVARSTVVTESRGTALREAGDILMAIDEGAVRPDVIAGNIADLVHGRVRIAQDRPRLFKSVGMGWEDLTVAAAAYDHNYPGGAA
ncbi:MAG TPA: hypothetical protein VFQ15_06435 [Jiangellaceae bacterium]|nr:hypothetical protein [Jiangellaceae bacterium]